MPFQVYMSVCVCVWVCVCVCVCVCMCMCVCLSCMIVGECVSGSALENSVKT